MMMSRVRVLGLFMGLVTIVPWVGKVQAEEKGNFVVQLDAGNFDDVVNGDKNVLVEYYADWCGHCKALIPVYENVAKLFKKVPNLVIAKVNADEEKELGSRAGVQGFPTIKFYPKGSTTAEEYSGGRADEDFVEFLNRKVGSKVVIPVVPSAVVDLTSSTFDSIALNPSKHVLVEFYAPWCGHCKQLAPKYEKAAEAFSEEEDVVIAKVNTDKHKDLGSRFDIKGFPTLKYFGLGSSTATDYEGARSAEGIVAFMNEKANTHRTVEGGLTEKAGLVKQINMIVDEHGQITDEVLTKVEKITENMSGSDLKHANLYVNALKKVLKEGDGYIEKEIRRLEGMVDSPSVTNSKKTLFTVRKNILSSLKKN